MINSINNAQTLSDIQGFLKENYFRIEGKEESFLQDLANYWDDGLLKKKLIDLKNSELAKRIDKIDPSKDRYMICQDIYNIIINQHSAPAVNSSSQDKEPFHYEIGESMISDIEWCTLI